MIGEQIGKYIIEAELGAGGMGAVYLAKHTMIGRYAAIKVLLPELSHNQELVTRFFNEAKATTAIRHPGIVEVYDFGQHTTGSAFIVMEYLEGEPLSARIHRGVMAPAEALAIIRQVASALGAAHAAGVIHRDLKPDNIFMVRDPDIVGGERIKILDFGIAKLAEEHLGGALRTRTGTVMGTPAYMAPEQCRGAGQVDDRADIYALGCILFEMMCGRRPFIGEGTGEVLAAQIHVAPPDPISLNASISAAHAAFVLRLLAKDPDQRPQSASALIAEIEALIGPGGHRVATAHPSMQTAVAPPGTLHPDTTLSAAAGASLGDLTGFESPRSGKWLPIGIVATFIGAGIIAVLVLSSKNDAPSKSAARNESDKTPAKTEPAAATTNDTKTPPTLTPQSARTLRLTVNSAPTGAELFLKADGRKLGKTPYVYSYTAGSGTLSFVLKLKGHKDGMLEWPAARGGTTQVNLRMLPPVVKRALVRKPRITRRRTRTKNTLKKKTINKKQKSTEGSVNPYGVEGSVNPY